MGRPSGMWPAPASIAVYVAGILRMDPEMAELHPQSRHHRGMLEMLPTEAAHTRCRRREAPSSTTHIIAAVANPVTVTVSVLAVAEVPMCPICDRPSVSGSMRNAYISVHTVTYMLKWKK